MVFGISSTNNWLALALATTTVLLMTMIPSSNAAASRTSLEWEGMRSNRRISDTDISSSDVGHNQ